MNKLPVIYVWTHDSIGLGEDGPTHQPVEHLMSLRAMPGLTVIRPCDANETVEAWKAALTRTSCPTALVLTRQKVSTLDRTKLSSAAGLAQGAYVLADAPSGKPEVILIATGSEVHLALKAREILVKEGVETRVVSMPSWELFMEQTQQYRDSVLPPKIEARLSIEAGVTFGWEKWLGSRGQAIGLDHFGASAPEPVLMEQFGFSPSAIAQKAQSLLRLSKA
jgi:transketolase